MKISKELLMYILYGRNDQDTPKKEPLPVVSSLPSDITIGYSMIPGAKFGVFAKQHIAKDLMVGPLNLPLGQQKTTDKPLNHDQLLIHESWSWLKHIQAARHPYEENARIDQGPDGIYFRVTHNISPGCEILAWFTDPNLYAFGLDLSNRSPLSSPKSNNQESPNSESSPAITPGMILPNKPICRLCGEVYSTYVELWAHVTTTHALPASTHALPIATPNLPTTSASTPVPTSSLYNYSNLPLNNILPLNISVPLTKPYPLVSPRMQHRDTSPSDIENGEMSDDIMVARDCRDTERPYECGHCGKSFSLPSSLRRHIITHTGERPYKCGYCGRAFAGATTLNNHIRIHTGEKPHVCHDCGAGFTQATQLNRHIRCCPNSKVAPQHHDQHHTEIFVS